MPQPVEERTVQGSKFPDKIRCIYIHLSPTSESPSLEAFLPLILHSVSNSSQISSTHVVSGLFSIFPVLGDLLHTLPTNIDANVFSSLHLRKLSSARLSNLSIFTQLVSNKIQFKPRWAWFQSTRSLCLSVSLQPKSPECRFTCFRELELVGDFGASPKYITWVFGCHSAPKLLMGQLTSHLDKNNGCINGCRVVTNLVLGDWFKFLKSLALNLMVSGPLPI